ncbi:type 2 periplasmic-binding domain-containing protein [Roseateles oligotrophus]|uniref:Solute-binding protein family 3/N-terminal domain-containing protein n=1 Tax=Roseateles oligotrophus TaxID=1769250 RepID=A0ABT2YJK7_9BURK|nr:hypothetical protein [Roseateles oligotrophus]MCV2370251.1 hypothetical protein [Roseateles oligotrophus]
MKASRLLQISRPWLLASGRRLCLLMFALSVSQAQSAPAPVFVMGSSADDTNYVALWQTMVHKEAFRRMQIPLAFTVAPLKRITMMSEQGAIDGEPGRAPAYGLAHPEMLVVDFPMMEVVFSIYAARPRPGLNRIEDLRDSTLKGAYARGALGCEQVLMSLFPATRLTSVTSGKNGLAMLAIGHADFYCDVSSSMMNVLNSAEGRKGPQPYKLFDLGPKVPLRPYVQKKHAALVPIFVATLKQMKEEGLFEKYWLEAEKQTMGN